MSNRTDWESVADEIEGLGRDRLIAELHNAYVAGQESIISRLNADIAVCERCLDGMGCTLHASEKRSTP